MARAASDPAARYRRAHKAGAEGKALPRDLSGFADSDSSIDTAYDAGANQIPYDQWQAENRPDLAPPPPPSGPPSSSSGPGRRTSARPRRRGPRGVPSGVPAPPGYRTAVKLAGGGISGLLLGAIAYAMVLSVVDYGTAGPAMWLKAKFLNEGSGQPVFGGSSSTSSGGSPGGSSGSGSSSSSGGFSLIPGVGVQVGPGILPLPVP